MIKKDIETIAANLDKSLDTTKGIIDSAQILHMYNKNIISMQQIKNNDLNVESKQTTKDPLTFVKEVLSPFAQQIKKKKINIKLSFDCENKNMNLTANWKIY
jgi:K+-sensing histidine kinase KdpD